MRPQGWACGRGGAHHRSEECWARSGRRRGWRAGRESDGRCTHGCTHMPRHALGHLCSDDAGLREKRVMGPWAGAGLRGFIQMYKCSHTTSAVYSDTPPGDTQDRAWRHSATRATWTRGGAGGAGAARAVALCQGCAVTCSWVEYAPRGSLGPLSYLMRVPCFGRPSVPCQKSSSASRRRADWSGFI